MTKITMELQGYSSYSVETEQPHVNKGIFNLSTFSKIELVSPHLLSSRLALGLVVVQAMAMAVDTEVPMPRVALLLQEEAVHMLLLRHLPIFSKTMKGKE